jgi:glycosyltransferase involved in cell wall biosynthesis
VATNLTVVVTALAGTRSNLLAEALASVATQLLMPDFVIVAVDTDRRGAALNRDAGLAKVDTSWVAFLDDDDRMMRHHLHVLAEHQRKTGADLVYPWFVVEGGTDPFPQWKGVPWDNEHPRQVPVTFLARTAALRAVGGFSHEFSGECEDPGTDPDGNRAGEDYRLILRLAAAGYRIEHLDERSWIWRHWGGNTSGLPSRVQW